MSDPLSVMMDQLDRAKVSHARVPDYVYAGPNDPVVWSWGSSDPGCEVVKRDRSAGPISPAMAVLRQAWRDIRKRCLNPKAVNYRHYGGRGIDEQASVLAYQG